MKDSQPMDPTMKELDKYIKANNERFSTNELRAIERL